MTQPPAVPLERRLAVLRGHLAQSCSYDAWALLARRGWRFPEPAESRERRAREKAAEAARRGGASQGA